MPEASESRPIRDTGVSVSRLSLGCAAFGNLFTPVAESEAAAVIGRALDLGLSYVDVAPHYGVGLAEERLGRALRGRSAVTVSTKVGRVLVPGGPTSGEGFVDTPSRSRVWDWSEAGIRRSIEDSLERLGLDRIDIAYLHDPDDAEEQVYATAFPALERLRDEGVVGAIGAGMNQAAMLRRFVDRLDLDVVLLAGRYTLLDNTTAGELLDTCRERRTAVVVGGAFNSGLLADPRPGATFDYAAAPNELVERALALRSVCEQHGVPLTAAALQFPLRHPAVVSVLTGVRSMAEIEANVASFSRPIPEALWGELA
jgi:D-threo-aldose 1-dehydrogenase